MSMICHILVILSTITIIKSKINHCNSPLLDNCFCGPIFYNNQTLFTVNCTNQGFTTTEMLENLPEQTQLLIFTGNHIETLSTNIFGDVDLSDLKIIDMSNNGIREIKGKAFHHVLGVERLILNHNNITISNQDDGNYHHPRVFSNFYNLKELHLTNAFADNTDGALADDLHDIFVNSNLTNLYKLHLEQNEIHNFKDVNVFCDLPNLHDIYLGDNNIPNLNFNVSCLKNLRYIDLESNNITKFYQQDLERFDRLAKPYRSDNLILEIKGNPFNCLDAIETLYDWLHTTNVEIRDRGDLECFHAKFGHKFIMNLHLAAESKHARLSRAVTMLLVTLTTVLIVLTIAYVYMKKDKVQNLLEPIIEACTRKVKYTTIESQQDV